MLSNPTAGRVTDAAQPLVDEIGSAREKKEKKKRKKWGKKKKKNSKGKSLAARVSDERNPFPERLS